MAQHVEPWRRWAAASDDHNRCYTCWESEDADHTGSSRSDDSRLEKHRMVECKRTQASSTSCLYGAIRQPAGGVNGAQGIFLAHFRLFG